MYIASNGIKTAVILNDSEPESPRTAYDNLGNMVCWHRRYNLGDPHNFDTSQEFAERLANNYLKTGDLFRVIQEGHLENYRLQEIDQARINDQLVGSHFQIQSYDGLSGHKEWHNTGWRCDKNLKFITAGGETLEDFFASMNTWELLTLLDKSDKVAILPLYLYDHSGLSISTRSYIGRAHHAEWDSSRVGYIWLDKDSAMENLCTSGDKVRLAQSITSKPAIHIQPDADVTPEKALEAAGYKPVHREDVVFTEEKILNDDWLDNGNLFKKDHKLFVLEGRESDGSFGIRPVATFNPDLLPLTDSNWKNRAMDILKNEILIYDNYLKGEVYGYEAYEGNVLEESVWGFNPGSEDIREVICEELGSWFGQDIKFEYCSDSNFDIDEYLKTHDFPELREKLEKDVRDFVTFESETSKVYPFAMSSEEILANKDDVLSHIVEELYSYHEDPDGTVLHDVITSHAGQARVVQPTLTVEDLDPNRDYTADELIGILKSKPSLADIILNAQSRKSPENSQIITPAQLPDR